MQDGLRKALLLIQLLDRFSLQEFHIGTVNLKLTAPQQIQKQKDRCYQSTVIKYLKTPLFVQESQYDWVVQGFLGVSFPFDANEQRIRNAYVKQLKTSLTPVAGVFSPRTNTHGLADSSFRFTTLKVNGLSFSDVLANWFFDRAGPTRVIAK